MKKPEVVGLLLTVLTALVLFVLVMLDHMTCLQALKWFSVIFIGRLLVGWTLLLISKLL